MGNPWKNGTFTYDLRDNQLFRKDADNVIYALGIQQVNTVGNLYFLDIYLSAHQCVEMHYHSNASELTYCISGKVEVAFINPSEEEWQRFVLEPGEAISIPQGFWHMACALTDDTHLLATHDNNNLQTVFGSDLLRLTPDELLAYVYCLDARKVEEALRPIKDTVIIGPPADCERNNPQEETSANQQMPTTSEPNWQKDERQPNGNGGETQMSGEQAKAEGKPRLVNQADMPESKVAQVDDFDKVFRRPLTGVNETNAKDNQPLMEQMNDKNATKLPVVNEAGNKLTEGHLVENYPGKIRDKDTRNLSPTEEGVGMNLNIPRFPLNGSPQEYENDMEPKKGQPVESDEQKRLQQTVSYGGSLMQPVHLCENCLPYH